MEELISVLWECVISEVGCRSKEKCAVRVRELPGAGRRARGVRAASAAGMRHNRVDGARVDTPLAACRRRARCATRAPRPRTRSQTRCGYSLDIDIYISFIILYSLKTHISLHKYINNNKTLY